MITDHIEKEHHISIDLSGEIHTETYRVHYVYRSKYITKPYSIMMVYSDEGVNINDAELVIRLYGKLVILDPEDHIGYIGG